MDTDDEINNSPTARRRGFFSGLAKVAIFMNEDDPSARLSFFSRCDHENGGFSGVGFVVACSLLPFSASEDLLDVEFHLYALMVTILTALAFPKLPTSGGRLRKLAFDHSRPLERA